MRSLIALLAAGLIAAPVVPKAASPAPPRPAPARAARAAPAPAAQPSGAPPAARAAPPRQSTGPASGGSTAVRPAPPPRTGTVSPTVRPAPGPGGHRYAPSHRYYPYYPYYPHYPYSAFGVGVAPFWWGLGWGWGYYSYYPYYGPDPYYAPYAPYAAPYAPYPPPAYAPPREAAPAQLTRVLSIQGGGHGEGGAGALAIGIDGRRLGFQASFGGVGEDRLPGAPSDDAAIVGWGLAHATWSFLSGDRYRMRLEAGVSMLYMPDSDAFEDQPYAETVAVGPSLGVSGHAGIVGPLGIEGHARLTPTPVPVADTRLAAALRGGPFAVTLGWRFIDVSGDDLRDFLGLEAHPEDAPEIRYSGPELGLSFRF